MTNRKLAVAMTVGILATASMPAFADPAFGYEVDYVLNPNGREVPQTPPPRPPAFGVEVDTVPGTFSRQTAPQADTARATEAAKDVAFASEEKGLAFGLRAFGHQSGA
jgi:hypothetical protein